MPAKNTEPTEPQSGNVTEAAEYFGCSRPSIYCAIERGGVKKDANGEYDYFDLSGVIEQHFPIIYERRHTPFNAWIRLTDARQELARLQAEIRECKRILGFE